MSFDSSRSANSGQKSKRSFNSGNSNDNSNSSNNNNKKKSSQKTLGMAWGSNSLSSSRSSFRKSPFSNIGSYMVEKNRKLQNQFDAEASSSSHSAATTSGRPIFHGVSIFVDGFTVPSSQELRGYMLKHGGRFENYFSRHRVTHIICSNLPNSKIKNLRSFSAGLPVVKPAWILDSVAANKLLTWVPYQLDQLANNQPKLSDFFAVRSSRISEDTSIPAICQAMPEIEDSSFNDGTSKNADSSELDESVVHKRLIRRETQDLLEDNNDEKMIEPPSGCRKSCEVNMAEPSSSHTENKSSVKNELESSLPQCSASVSSHCFNDNISESRSSTVVGPSKNPHSTLGDPNFVENYFKSSRLHFIGTWRNRYRKRFPSYSGIQGTCSSLKVSSDALRTAIIHVDMDCFFVSVIIRSHPELQDKAVAVCHSDNPKGTAEISSANYPARAYGVRAGMFVRDAKALCPHLVILPYNFDAYEEVADQLYNILHKHCKKVQAVSCDEAFLDVKDLEGEDPQLLASKIRKEIFETTACTASAGIAGNMLMARLATRSAKPNGQCYIPPEEVDEYLHQLPIKALPGIGHVLEEKLKKQNVWTCGQLRMITKESLQKDYGMKTGEMLWNYSRGVDNRPVGLIQESKSIGAEVNWGVRFRDLQDTQHFLLNLCKEVSLRLQGSGVQGRTFTLKIKKRRKDSDEPAKYMGHGHCDNLSHSMTVPVATDDVEVLQRITKQLFGSFHLDVKDIRGMGLQVSKLESVDICKIGAERNTLKSWLTSASAGTEEQCTISSMRSKVRADIDSVGQTGGTLGHLSTNANEHSIQMDRNLSNGQECLNQVSALPPLCHLDMGVLENLPPELFSELNEVYDGKLTDFIAKKKGEGASSSFCNSLHEHDGAKNKGDGSALSVVVPFSRVPEGIKVEQHIIEEMKPQHVSRAEFYNEAIPTSGLNKIDLMPSSLSQIDTSVLQQLPDELRADILELLPAHRRFYSNVASAASENLHESVGIKADENLTTSIAAVGNNNLWVGNPPQWVDKFKASNFFILKILAEVFYKLGSTGNLSQILQHTVSAPLNPQDASSEGWDEAIYNLSELLKQYIILKIEVDIEEIYVCFRLMRRIMMKSEFFVQVYNIVLPFLQTSVCQNYGGSIQL
ncbi:hypothetical protein LWI28_010199 [Acer negundo]|uniref:DNA repair protein REV1 n=1 Tax=Acer negundo TaxID=4023 RepID=A0AAD5IZH5_ACENE|nr:hypothetical protein LWI28_010199 [Acer negundo]